MNSLTFCPGPSLIRLQPRELVMEELHRLDEVAYVRYASVYRHFQDVEAFREEVDRLHHRRGRIPSEDQLSLLPDVPQKPKKGKRE